MPWTIDDHKASAQEAIDRGLMEGEMSVLAEVPEPFQGTQHQARVMVLTAFNALGGGVTEPWVPWDYDATPPVEPPVEPPIVEPGPEPLPPFDVVLNSSMDIQQAVEDAGADANIGFEDGLYQGITINPLSNQTFVGVSGTAILDGAGTNHAMWSPDRVGGVTVKKLEIRNYTNPQQQGAINMDGVGWTVEDCEIHHNWGLGLKMIEDQATIRNNNIHHQHQLGIGGGGKNDLVEGNEIAFNNWLAEFSWGWEAGGTKFWDTEGLVVHNNYSHDNHGPGLWADYNNDLMVMSSNTVEDNYGPGIFQEIGYSAKIHGNTVKRNSITYDPKWLWGAGIMIAASQDVEVYDNTVEGNFNGITLIQQNRESGGDYGERYGPWVVQNNLIRDNVIIDSGITGAAQDISDPAIYHSNNVYSGNTYEGVNRWKWEDGYMTWDQWIAIHPGEA